MEFSFSLPLKIIAVALPVASGIASVFLRHHLRAVRALVIATGVIHAVASALLAAFVPALGLAAVVLCVTSLLFLIAVGWSPRYLVREQHSPGREARFFGFLTAFLGAMSLVALADNLALMWVAVEATTLVSAPLICFHDSKASLEAMWKYLLLCSIGIALALLATMMLGLGATDPRWYKAAFVLALCGYGAKMGLAPFHMWLPDAHSESPAVVSGLLSGALLNCSFLAILRFRAALPPELAPFCAKMMLTLGVASLAVAAVFIVRQTDFKRMLAYSSVEHMGLITILFALGLDIWGCVHLCAHSVIKMSLFLTAGEILHRYGTRRIASVSGMFAARPALASVWCVLIALICAAPPSPLFFTEFALVKSAPFVLGATVLLLLFVVFAGMTHAALRMVCGDKD